jgi:hypothetical protein
LVSHREEEPVGHGTVWTCESSLWKAEAVECKHHASRYKWQNERIAVLKAHGELR